MTEVNYVYYSLVFCVLLFSFILLKIQDVPKHSVHTLVFRSLKRTHDMFLSDYSHPIEFDQKSIDIRKNSKALAEYGPVLDFPKDTNPISKKNEVTEENKNDFSEVRNENIDIKEGDQAGV